ncbi:MAG: NAD-dependent epimerase/dehydratase family protein [Thermoleophilaceae bacterium]
MRLGLRSRSVAYFGAGGAGPPTEATEFPLDGVSVPAFGDDSRIESHEASAFIAHPTEQRCFEVRTRYGRSIRVTGDHSIFVESEDGPEPRPVTELEVGQRVAVARRIELPERDRTEIDMLDVWQRAELDPWALTVEAPGLGALAWEQRQDLFGLLASERRNAGPNWRKGAWTQIIRMRETNRLPLPVARRLGCTLPTETTVRQRVAGRSVPLPRTIAMSDDLLWLLGLWVAEGCIHERPGDSFLTISGQDALLARAATVIEDHLGLHCVWGKASAARAASLFVHSKLLCRLMGHLGFGQNRKRIPGWILGLPLARLKWFIEGYREGDGVHSGKKLEAGVRHEFSTVSEELKDDLIVAFARFGLVPSVDRYESRLRHKTGDRVYPFWRLTLCQMSPWSPLEWDGGTQQTLNARVSGDLVWASITAIEEIEPTSLVYDFSVPGAENFWAGTGVMAHNTYGPRMRPNDGRAIPACISQALTGKPVTVCGDGSQTRSFCYVDDLIRGLVLLAESGVHEPVNIGNPSEMTLLEMARQVVEATGSKSEVVFEALPVDDPQVRQPDITRARELLGWEPQVALHEGLPRTVEYFSGMLAVKVNV